MMKEAEATVGAARDAVAALNVLMADLQKSAGNLNALTQQVSAPDGVPAILEQTDQNLATLKKILDDVAVATQRTPAIAKNSRAARPTCRPC